jgi:16S rRNA (guanine966-N2)-methyltransferase
VDVSKNRKRPQQGVRIIAGEWRGRRLTVPNVEGLRPTGDRVRETLFNWLQTALHKARCIDLFAGTGALGFEAASRGAGEVTLVEKSPVAVNSMIESVDLLGASQVRVIRADAMDWIQGQAPHSADIVFVDPPFGLAMSGTVIKKLAEQDVVSPGGLVYLETAREEGNLPIDTGWELKKEKLVGEVRMQLFSTT